MKIGSVAARAVGQLAHDIHLTDYWNAAYPKFRHLTVCVSPSIVINTVQRCSVPNGVWQGFFAGPLLTRMTEAGTVYTPLPPILVVPQIIILNNIPVLAGYVMTWLDEMDEYPWAVPTLHYHQHRARPPAPNHLAAPAIMAQNLGTHMACRKIHFGSQVQSYRDGFR
ncbi:hypothetical protein C8R44DRAFT_987855 [Mycena epipterygia]|nr:hypothetical protein C8R44DRAFT_987855 [Mycena epipterygia]